MVEGLRPTQLIKLRQTLLERLLRVVEKLQFVCCAGRAALGASTIVGDYHNQGIVEFADALQVVEQATKVIVGVGEEAGKDLHHACVEFLLLWRK